MTSCGPPKLTGPDMCEMEADSETQHSLHNPVKPSVGWGLEGPILVEFVSPECEAVVVEGDLDL